MGTLNEDLSAIKTVEDTLTSNKVARFAYTDLAYTNNDANGVAEYNVNNEQNIPVATANVMKVNDTVLSKGYRAQASSVTRMLLNHFLGRLSYNVNKVNDNMSNLLATLISHRGTANGLATLDTDGRIPYSQLPESAVELKGYWNADTNTPTLADGTGDDGDEYYVDVAGSQDLGSGTQYFNVGDRVLYIDGVWKNINSTAVKSVNSVLPSAQGDVALPTKVISIDNTLTVTGAPSISAGDTVKALFTANITGTDSATAMSISYNGTSYTVKVPKEGILSDFVATELTTGNFTYIDAYKYLELMFNGTDFIIIGNPLVLSGEDYEVYADGYKDDPIVEQQLNGSDDRAWIVFKSGRVQLWQRKTFTATYNRDDLTCFLPYTSSKILNVQITAQHGANGTSLNVSSTWWKGKDEIIHYSVRSMDNQQAISGGSCYVEYIKS